MTCWQQAATECFYAPVRVRVFSLIQALKQKQLDDLDALLGEFGVDGEASTIGYALKHTVLKICSRIDHALRYKMF